MWILLFKTYKIFWRHEGHYFNLHTHSYPVQLMDGNQLPANSKGTNPLLVVEFQSGKKLWDFQTASHKLTLKTPFKRKVSLQDVTSGMVNFDGIEWPFRHS